MDHHYEVEVDLTPLRPFFTVKKLAVYLDVEERTVRKWVASGTIESVKIGASRRMSWDAVHEFIGRHRWRP